MSNQLKTQAVSGVKWNALSMVVLTGFRFVTLAILARLLAPSDFGLMGMIMVAIEFTYAFADMGLSNAIIQRQKVPESHLSTFFWLNIFIGIVLFLCLLLLKPLVVLFFKKPELAQYLLLATLTFLIAPINQIFITLLNKNLQFDILSKIEIAAAVVYSFSTIVFALGNFGVLSLIFGQLLRNFFMAGLLVFSFRKTWLPGFHFNLTEIRSYLRFGAFQMGERAVNYFNANIDYIIIGRFLGPEALGFYTLAYQLVTFPLMKINPIVTRVAFPAFSKIQDDHAKMRKGYCRVIHYISMISFPMLTGMLIVAPEFITLVYSAKWTSSIVIVQILCVVGMFKSLGNPIGSVLLAKGRADIGFYWNVFVITIISLAVIVGVNWGITGVAVAILILQFPLFCVIQPIVNGLIGLSFQEYFEAIQLPLLCSGIMFVGTLLVKILFGNLNEPLRFIITVTFGTFIYIASYYMQDRTAFLELKSLAKGNS